MGNYKQGFVEYGFGGVLSWTQSLVLLSASGISLLHDQVMTNSESGSCKSVWSCNIRWTQRVFTFALRRCSGRAWSQKRWIISSDSWTGVFWRRGIGQKLLNSWWQEEEKISLAGGTCRLCVPAMSQSYCPRLQQQTQTSPQPPSPLPALSGAENKQILLPCPQLPFFLLCGSVVQFVSNTFPGQLFRPGSVWCPQGCWYNTSQHTGKDKRRCRGLRGKSHSNHA